MQDYLRKHPDCEVYDNQDESLDMKAIREQRKNPGLPNATYVNYLVDPESSQLYLQMNASSRRSRPTPAASDGYGNEQYGYQQVRFSCQRTLREHRGARATVILQHAHSLLLTSRADAGRCRIQIISCSSSLGWQAAAPQERVGRRLRDALRVCLWQELRRTGLSRVGVRWSARVPWRWWDRQP